MREEGWTVTTADLPSAEERIRRYRIRPLELEACERAARDLSRGRFERYEQRIHQTGAGGRRFHVLRGLAAEIAREDARKASSEA